MLPERERAICATVGCFLPTVLSCGQCRILIWINAALMALAQAYKVALPEEMRMTDDELTNPVSPYLLSPARTLRDVVSTNWT